ncbi:hypothetical protein IF157_21385 [Salmonella enterica subsp. enterica serovar Typhimurium]|uniref:Uncharacterized protein n=2 Tax=root TaxID=1 RepID=A0A8E7L238_9CAUD|nr:hypothetical protein [Salmonella enterica]YP_010582390.1 hypothetical protein PF622_gp17 [Salmonella phage vB_STM-ZS]WOZ15132.1 hypothetical protein [Salmonella phage STP-1]EHQ2949263.1 hypothetical protein [Salmonella enterica]MBU4707801.1 hypothetical protein [Salmonella enterica subsp. enterica serovar Typhimurium]MBU4814039.1 hypothetical protein [Salmonella enterica subsp. enterica serovar Typhimurium]MBU4818223.1 hypothetical protein [Salmonella enterica subsp. enterica serovar Typhi
MNTGYWIFVGIMVAGFIGWVMNIVKIFDAGPISEWTAAVLVRVIVVFVAPIGAIFGWF